MSYMLGKLPAKNYLSTPKLHNYLKESLPKPPASINWSGKVLDWGMMKNDTVGDCTIAAVGHLLEEWTAYNGKEFIPTDDQIITAYSAITGYDPKTGDNDTGSTCEDVCRYWLKTGIADHKIDAFMSFKLRGWNMKNAVYLFGGAYIGVEMPLTAQTQLDNGEIWSVSKQKNKNIKPGSWGGHCVPIVAYNNDSLTCVTWGKLQDMTWSFLEKYGSEFYIVLSQDWVNKNTLSPSQFDYETLKKDLELI